MATDFNGVHYPKSVILFAVFFYVRYAVPNETLRKSWLTEASPLISPPKPMGGKILTVNRP